MSVPHRLLAAGRLNQHAVRLLLGVSPIRRHAPLPLEQGDATLKKFSAALRSVRLLACLVFLLPAPGLAQPAPYVPGDLSRNEIQALELAGAHDQALAGWRRERAYDVAKENFRRAAMLERCTAITALKPDELDFAPAVRAALEGVVDNLLAGKIVPMTPQDYRRGVRVALWAQRHSDAGKWQALWRQAQTSAGRRALQRLRAIGVMDEYGGGFLIDLNTGATLAYPPIALKAYFTRSGQLEVFDRALRTVDPALGAAFARVRGVREHADADLAWLRELGQALDKKMPAVSKAFYASLPEEEQNALADLLASPFFSLYDDALGATSVPLFGSDAHFAAKIDDPKFRGMVIGDRGQPNYSEFVRASLESEYPQSAVQVEAFYRFGPRDLIDYAHRPFCTKTP